MQSSQPPQACLIRLRRQRGLSLVELMVSVAISAVILSGVVATLLASKSNFLSQRELAALQENARFAVKYLSDEIRMAGASGCGTTPLNIANAVDNGSSSWYLNGMGLQGFEYDAGINTFPTEFKMDVRANTDALVVRRGDSTGLQITSHNGNSAQFGISGTHSYKPGQIMVVSSPDCEQVGIFQITGPTNNSNNANNIIHNTGNSTTPGNCVKALQGSFSCVSGSAVGTTSTNGYYPGSSLMELHSEAYYVGNSESDSTVPALFREHLLTDTAASSVYTAAEELVQGVENLQALYGVDTDNNGLADKYVKANDAFFSTATNWRKVVSVRLSLRLRSVAPVYPDPVSFTAFEGVAGTNGSDRYLRQELTTTVRVRNN